MNGNRIKQKTRNLPIFDYLEKLQNEYVIAELRKKIYFKKKDKAYWEKIMIYKKEIITDISQRNNLPSLFTDAEEKIRQYGIVYKEKGCPMFTYKDEVQKLDLHKKDIYNYYTVQSDFKVIMEEGVKVGVLTEVNFEKQVVWIKLRGEADVKPYSIKNVARIL